MVKVFAGHSVAFVAGLDLVLGEFFATSFDVAVFGSGETACAVGYFAALSRYSFGVGYVCFADATVHSARSNKFSCKFGLGHKLCNYDFWLNYFAFKI